MKSVFLSYAKKLTAMLLLGTMMCAALGAAAEGLFVSERLVDPTTHNDWRTYFDVPHTGNAGGVWTDKSVFVNEDTGDGDDGVPDVFDVEIEEENFLIALSAIAANKSITGYEHIPTDTVIVLDMSSSMHNGSKSYIGELESATNAALTQLLELNNNNRVSVIMYSGNENGNLSASGKSATTILMPLARYDTTHGKVNGVRPYLVSSDTDNNRKIDTIGVNNNVTVLNEETGAWSTYNPAARKYMTGTFIQDGIYEGMRQLLMADTVIEEGFQAGTSRIPVIVLMTDGKPTAVTNHFAGKASTGVIPSVENGYGGANLSVYDSLGGNIGAMYGGTNDNQKAFLTQLTASYAREMVDRHYGRAPMFYTLGFNISSDTYAASVMNPSKSTDTINGYWEDYLKGSVKLNNYTIYKNSAAVEKNYVDAYFSATTGGMTDAFNSIVRQIILQSLYYPTLADSGMKDVGGYIEFLDDVGEYMEVKEIKGIRLGAMLYTGEEFAKALVDGDMGRQEDGTNTTLGDNFVWSVAERMDITNQQARDLISHAWGKEELAYTDADNWSNHIKWYADENHQFIPFGSEDIPAGAKYENRSYAMLGAVSDETGMRNTNMMYVTVRVETEIATGKQQVVWKIPSTLIPLYSYKVQLADKATSVNDGDDVTVTTTSTVYPIRLLYEVGLRSDINAYNLDQKIADDYAYAQDGKHTFYSNQWNPVVGEHPHSEINMVSWFEPSKENERYYYTENSTIYVKNLSGTYSPYEGDNPNNESGKTFYRQYIAFAGSSTGTNQPWKAQARYEEISSQSLAQARQNADGVTWYIPKGVVHRIYPGYTKAKTHNDTGTFGYFDYPSIELSDGVYYADNILGNNGLIRMESPTGLRIKKLVAEGDHNTAFTITISGPAGNKAYAAQFLHADGTVNAEKTSVTFNNGQASVQLKHGEQVTIIGLPAGEYSAVETIPAHWDLEKVEVGGLLLSDPVGDGVRIQFGAHQVPTLVFTNSIVETGGLEISKHVDLNGHVLPEGYEPQFTFKVTLDTDDTTLLNEYATSRGDKVKIENNSFTIKLGADESVVIHDLPLGNVSKITVEEIHIPDGFVPDQRVKTLVGGNASQFAAEFTNTYQPVWPDEPDYQDVQVNLTKKLTGREWLAGDSFSFKLEYLDTAGNKQVGDPVTVTLANLDANDKTKAVTDAFTAILRADLAQIDRPGEYTYHIHEIVPAPQDRLGGVTYEETYAAYINVSVKDDNGELVIADVQGGRLASVSKAVEGNNTTWTIEAGFTNTYAISEDGYGLLELHIAKQIIDSESGLPVTTDRLGGRVLSYAGYEFELRSPQGVVVASAKTDENGAATIHYHEITSEAQSGAYTLVEKPRSDVPGMSYDPVTWTIEIKATDNQDGTMDVRVLNVSSSRQAEAPYQKFYVGTGEDDNKVYDVAFVNAYAQGAVTVPVRVLKTMNNFTGRVLSPEGFAFILTDEQGNVLRDDLGRELRAVSDKNGHAELSLKLKETDVGVTKVYLREEPGQVEHVVYSKAVYPITITVARGEGNALTATVKSEGEEMNDEAFAFENIYGDPAWLHVPATGDASHLLAYAAACALAVCGLIVLRMRRKA